MELRKLITYCLAKPNARKDHTSGDFPMAIKVASNLFALITSSENKLYISLRCDNLMAETLVTQFSSIKLGSMICEENWITIKIDSSIPDDELYWMIDHSYELASKYEV